MDRPSFIPIDSLEKHHFLVRSASITAVCVALILVSLKYYAWRSTASLSLQASLIDSLLDMGASLASWIIIKQAQKPADKEHRFGHGKAEALAGLAQSTFIIGAAFFLLMDIIERLIEPAPLVQSTLGTIVILIASFLTSLLILFQRYVIKKTNSLAVVSDKLHYEADLLTDLGVIISLNVSSWLGWERLDPIIGLFITFFIFKSAWEIIRRSLDVLMDRELDDNDRERIINCVFKNRQVLGIHELRTRMAGSQQFIQMHISLEPTMNLLEAHQIAEEVCDQVKESFPYADILIHQDPHGCDDMIETHLPNPYANTPKKT